MAETKEILPEAPEKSAVKKDSLKKVSEVPAVPKGMVRIRLEQPHTHEGKPYVPGDEITVDESSADYIVKHKSGKRV